MPKETSEPNGSAGNAAERREAAARPGFLDENKPWPYTDLATVESQRNDLIFEEFPEGPYGSPLVRETLGKSTPWREDQRPPNRFDYENRMLHAGMERHAPGDQGEGNAAMDTFHEEVVED